MAVFDPLPLTLSSGSHTAFLCKMELGTSYGELGTALVNEVCAQFLPPVQGYPELGWAASLSHVPLPCCGLRLGRGKRTRHWVLHGELWQQKRLGTVPFSPMTSSKVAPFRFQEAKSASGKTFLPFQ